MKRSHPLRRGKPLARVSPKRRAGARAWARVYAQVDARSEGRCEIEGHEHRATEHHHLFKPRALFHEARYILHVCSAGHREFEQAFAKGRRVLTAYDPTLGRYWTRLVTAPDKFAARRLA